MAKGVAPRTTYCYCQRCRRPTMHTTDGDCTGCLWSWLRASGMRLRDAR